MKTNLANNIWKSFLACAALLLIGGCTDDPIYSGSEAVNGVKIYIKVPAPSVSQTRAATDADDYYNADGVYLLAFNGNDDSSTLLQMVRTSAGGNNNTLYAKVKSDAAAKRIYLVANVENQIAEWAVGTTLATIKEALKSTLPLKEGVLTSMITPQPMIGYINLSEGIKENTTIGDAATPILLERSTAKISLQNKADNFTIAGANLVNAPVSGYLFSSPDKLASIGTAHSGKEGNIEEMLVTPAEGVQNCALYTFESDDSKSTAIVIKATYLGKEGHYYRLDLNTKEAEYALLRNYNYIVTINKVAGKGHATAEDAIANPASNLEYDINVVDAYSRDIISNGKYYLGVSNTEFYAFADAISSDVVICTITHNAPEEVLGELPTTGGIKLETTTLPKGTGNEQSTEIRIKSIPDDFTTGAITIKLGDLERVITIHRISTNPSKFGALLVLDDLTEQYYIAGLVEAEDDKEWLRLTTTIKEEDLKEEDQFDRLESADKPIRIRVRANMGDNSSPKFRTGYVNLLKKDKVGNARVMIKQEVHDLYSDIQVQAKADSYTYVGTFHRHDQVGERIIRVKTEVVGTGGIKWRARVLSGDFIRLSNVQSEDKGVTRDSYGVGDATINFGDAIEKLYQVVDGATLINQPKGANDIYFRVGLTSHISANSVRYGIIGLFVNQKNIDKDIVSHYIFVRQGEEADYLMRPKDPAVQEPKDQNDPFGDPTPPSFISGTRDKAVKIVPFNLTEKGNSDNTSDLSGKQGDFCTYPSQAGYLYQTITRLGWWADPGEDQAPKPSAQGFSSWEWEDKYETCPTGYVRAIGDRDLSYYGTDSLVYFSPMRQSLWLYPKEGGISNTQNFIIGYIADGFYDRQPMWHKPSSVDWDQRGIDQPTIVAKGSQTAFMGVLSFNPRTLASIFLPMAGYYVPNQYSKFVYKHAGFSGGFYTQGRFKAGDAPGGFWTVDYGMLTQATPPGGDFGFRADNYAYHDHRTAYNIRCIRKQ